jgi:hypothetical protein
MKYIMLRYFISIEYFKVAQKALSAYNPKCSAHIREATIMISDLLKTKNGTEFIQKKFK